MSRKHFVIIVCGLGDKELGLRIATRHFRLHGLTPVVHLIGWHSEETDFVPKLDRLIALIDLCAQDGNRVSLIGTSAGASAVLNAFVQRKDVVNKVISVTGVLRPSVEKGWRSFETRTKSSRPFAQSVTLFVSKEQTLSKADRKRIMTIYPKFGDELVAPDTATLDAAVNIQIPTTEHVLSIGLALTVFSGPIFKFLQ